MQQLKKALSKCKIKPAFATQNKVGNSLYNGKDKISKLQKSGVYKIECSRSIKARLKEHTHRITTSNVCKHLFVEQHNQR